MARTLILAESGFGKSSMIGPNPEIGIWGLDPKITYVISATTKILPFENSLNVFPVTTYEKLIGGDTKGRKINTNSASEVAKIILALIPTPIQHIVVDDTNYLMQDQYMKDALKSGWDAPKKIGYQMGLLFDAIEQASQQGKEIYVLAHWETYKKKNDSTISYRMKTTGNMVAEFITPEGKFENLFFGDESFDERTKVVKRFLVTNKDGTWPAKSAPGMFPLHIPNDLGYIAKKVSNYFNGVKEELDHPFFKTE